MIPFATTTVTVNRPPEGALEDDSQAPWTYVTVTTGIPANFIYLSGNEARTGGNRERVDRRCIVDYGVDIRYYDQLVDDVTGDVWQVAWSRPRTGLGLDHLEIGVYAVVGFARGIESN